MTALRSKGVTIAVINTRVRTCPRQERRVLCTIIVNPHRWNCRVLMRPSILRLSGWFLISVAGMVHDMTQGFKAEYRELDQRDFRTRPSGLRRRMTRRNVSRTGDCASRL